MDINSTQEMTKKSIKDMKKKLKKSGDASVFDDEKLLKKFLSQPFPTYIPKTANITAENLLTKTLSAPSTLLIINM